MGAPMNDPELFDFDEHDEVEPTATWADFQLFKVAEDAPAHQPINSAFDAVIIRGGVKAGMHMDIQGSHRWSFVQRFIEPVVDDEGDANEFFCPKEGQVVIWREHYTEDGPMFLSPPSLVVFSSFIEEEGEHVVTCLTDNSLSSVAIEDVPFPLDAVAMRQAYWPVCGWVRKFLLDLWPLNVDCPRCGDIARLNFTREWGMGQDTHSWCLKCRSAWVQHSGIQLMADMRNFSHLSHWALHLILALKPLADAGWAREPAEVEWTWEQGLLLTLRYTRRDEMIIAYYDPDDYQIALLGPVEFGVCKYVDSREGPEALIKMIDECAPWILSDFTQLRLELFDQVVDFGT